MQKYATPPKIYPLRDERFSIQSQVPKIELTHGTAAVVSAANPFCQNEVSACKKKKAKSAKSST